MDAPLLLVLLGLPFAVAAAVLAVSSLRRRRHAPADGSTPEPVHRGQADTAAVQSARVHPAPSARRVRSGRDRRAESAERPD